MAPMLETCTCGVVLPEAETSESPVHPYMLSTPSCWAAYGRLLAREYEDPARWPAHRYAVDAYAVQHPGIDTPQARNSLGIHLSRLGLLFDFHWPLARANDAMLAITAKKFAYAWLPPPTHPAGVTVADVLATENAEAHMAAVLGWAEAVWKQWSAHHAIVRGWLDAM